MVTIHPEALAGGAWEQIRQRAMRRLRVLLRGLPSAAVEDVAQEVLLGLHRSIALNGPPRGIDALVAVICRRKAASALRRLRVERRHIIHDEAAIQHARSQCPDPDEGLLRVDDARTAHRVLECLRARGSQSEAIARGRLEGLGFQDIAGPLGITADAARQAWHRSAIQVRRALLRSEFLGPAEAPVEVASTGCRGPRPALEATEPPSDPGAWSAPATGAIDPCFHPTS